MSNYFNKVLSGSFIARVGAYAMIGAVVAAALALIYGLLTSNPVGHSTPLSSGAVIAPDQGLAGMTIANDWRFRQGDDRRWAAPDYDDSDWQRVDFPHRWYPEAESLPGQAFGWYRKSIQFELPDERARERLALLSVQLGTILSAYELYAGDQLIGRVGRLPTGGGARVDYGTEAVFPVPLETIGEGGELVLSLRVWAGSEVIAERWGAGPYGGLYRIGSYRDMLSDLVMNETPTFLLGVTCIIFGLYHLLLFFRNRELADFLWFGLTSVVIGIYCITLTEWRDHFGFDPELFKKLEFMAIYLLPPLSIQMAWSMFDERLGPWVRLYQLSFITIAVAWSLVPGIDIHVSTLTYWLLWTLPALFLIGRLIVQKLQEGNVQARAVALGAFLFLIASLVDIVAELLNIRVPGLLPWGFLALSLGVGNFFGARFSVMLNHLEHEVSERTSELSEANRRLSEIVRIDPLTELLNRRGFVIEAEQELHRVGRSGRNFSVILADVDHFKSVNDHYGHAGGDHVLARLAARMRESIRDIDRVARWGGEEFIFLLPETELDGARVLAEKLRQDIQHSVFEFNGSKLQITLTLGIATIRPGESLEGCVARADRALYQGKHGGRNNVRVAGAADLSLLPSGPV